MNDLKRNVSYQPVSCDLHSQYELAIMHKNKLCLSWLEGEGDEVVTETNITPVDVQTKNKAEYLIAKTAEQKPLCLRLDHIIKMKIMK